MTLVQIINSILVLLLPFLIAFCYYLAQFQIQRLPGQQRAALAQFAHMAACYVEQEGVRQQKKEIAKAYATDCFRLFGLPIPHEDILEVAIGAAMYEIQHNGQD